MKVGNNSNANLAGIEKSKTDRVDIKSNKEIKSKQADEGGAAGASAKVQLSDRAQQMKKIKDIAISGDEVDMSKVEKFQKLIDEGKYSVDAADIADRMVNEHLLMN